jgi:hypothetical protein
MKSQTTSWVEDVALTRNLRTVVSSLCVGLAETINKVGPGFLENSEYLEVLGETP